VDVAKLQVRMETGKNLPTVAIGAGYTYMNFDRGRPAEMKDNFGMAFATVSVPISGWWGGSHATKKKKLELRAAETSRQENAALLLLQMQNLWDELNGAYRQVLLAGSIVPAYACLKLYDAPLRRYLASRFLKLKNR
jgi:outer membrane protein TolC